MLLLWFWSTTTDVAMTVTRIETFYGQDTFTKLILPIWFYFGAHH